MAPSRPKPSAAPATGPTPEGAAPISGRREFLARLWKGLGLLAAAELVAAAGAYLAPRKDAGAPAARQIVDVGQANDLAPGTVRPVPQGKFYLVRLDDGGFLALSARCTHLGCTVEWDEQRKAFPCPCHASIFDPRGEVASPPATRALDLFPVQIQGGVVKVDTGRRMQRSNFDPGQVTYP